MLNDELIDLVIELFGVVICGIIVWALLEQVFCYIKKAWDSHKNKVNSRMFREEFQFRQARKFLEAAQKSESFVGGDYPHTSQKSSFTQTNPFEKGIIQEYELGVVKSSLKTSKDSTNGNKEEKSQEEAALYS
jgi:hypothetical protein